MKRTEHDSEADTGLVSKSQKRRDALETLALGSKLVALPKARLGDIPLESDVLEAIEETRQIRSNVARKRQLHYLAKLLRRVDEQPILDALDAIENEARHLTARHHRTETWRDELLENGDRALGKLLDQRRDADAQTLRQLLRNAHREASAGKPPASARALFRVLRELDEQEALPPV